MVMIECPWCEEAVVDAALETIRCDGCAIQVEFAPDGLDEVALAA